MENTSAQNAFLKSYNPQTEEVIQEIPQTPVSEIAQMVKRSQRAQKLWADLPNQKRIDQVAQAYAALEDHKDELIEMIHLEMGKPLAEATSEVTYYLSKVSDMAKEVAEALKVQKITAGSVTTEVHHDPLGVCASITPWNFPVGMPTALIIPSLMVGNTVLFKPSEEVTVTGLLWAKLLNQHLPQDILQVVVGAGVQGEALVKSEVQLVTFTGSKKTGQQILKTAGADLKRVILELGGKDSLIVMKDADLKKAAQYAAQSALRNTGQTCVSTERIYVDESIEQDFIEALKAAVPTVALGPMVHRTQKDHVIAQTEEALKMGAVLAFGDLEVSKGNDLRCAPMILTKVTPEMGIMKDETFGPVACVATYQNVQQAVDWANDNDYALGSAVFSTNEEDARRVARQLDAGMVGVNRGCGGAAGSPWVGAKKSGYGYHGSPEGHRLLTQLRILTY